MQQTSRTSLTSGCLQVFLGLHDAGDKRSATNRSVERIILHPHFEPDNYNNDIALLRLSQRVEFNELIRPVCLPPPHLKVGQVLRRIMQRILQNYYRKPTEILRCSQV